MREYNPQEHHRAEFGPFSVSVSPEPKDEVLGKNIEIKKGDFTLVISIEEVPEESREGITTALVASYLKKIAEFADSLPIKPKHVSAITYEKLGQIAELFGFVSIPTGASLPVRLALKQEYWATQASKMRKPMGKPVTVYQTFEDFEKRFNKKN